jgi:membrane associated rhomboid family serine protease
MLPGSLLTIDGQYAPIYTPFEPWRMLTAGFLHSTSSIVPMHLALNMYSLYIFGRALEPMLGSAKFFWLYVISLFGGSVGVLLLSDVTQPTVGASGAIFGLMGAYFVLAKSLGYNSNQFVSLIAINLVFGFIMPGIAWQAHVGGLAAGLLVGAAFVTTRRATKAKQNLYLAAVAVGLVALTVITSTVRLAGVF